MWVVSLDSSHGDDVLEDVGCLVERLAWCDFNLGDLACFLVGSDGVDGVSTRFGGRRHN